MATTKNKQRKWAKYRSDFPQLVVSPLHLDLHFDVRDDLVVVRQNLSLRNVSEKTISTVELDANNLIDLKIWRYEEFKPLGNVKQGGADFQSHVDSLKAPNIVNLARLPVRGDIITSTYSNISIAVSEIKAVSKEKIIVDLGVEVSPGKEFVLRTENAVKPTSNVLEGIYYDYTLSGDYPKTMITQCQQYGFQRIVPAIDRMSAKAFFTTTIVADKRYTNLISTGDLAPGYFKIGADGAKIPVYKQEENGDSTKPERKVIKYCNHLTLEYPDGDVIDLQLLSLPAETKLNEKQASRRKAQYTEALEALHDSVLWTYHSTGPEANQHNQERKQVKELITKREALKKKLLLEKAQGKAASTEDELKDVRSRLKQLMKVWTNTGYKYTGQTYREIGMQNSNYGGMENVGNTTILQSRLAPTDYISDGAYVYMEAVKIHEYYHNINGSQVTGYSPFEIWLNEAVTVHMERRRSAEIFGDGHIRLSQVARAFIPGAGPLATDSGPRAMPVEPEALLQEMRDNHTNNKCCLVRDAWYIYVHVAGFNITNELITGMTYFKAPEFVRMVELLMGEDLFNKGLHLYHESYKNANATSMQWIEAMEKTMKEANKQPSNLKMMACGWLKRSGHPHVIVDVKYVKEAKQLKVAVTQKGFEGIKQTLDAEEKGGPWDIGFDFKSPWMGKEIEMIYKQKTHNLTVSSQKGLGDQEEPDFFSFARGFSYFGTYQIKSATAKTLALQASTDTDLANRFLSYRAIANAEKVSLVEKAAAKAATTESDGKEGGPKHQQQLLTTKDVSPEYIKAHLAILFDEKLEGTARSLICMESESVERKPQIAHRYWLISEAKTTMLAATYQACESKICSLFDKLEAKNESGALKNQLHDRALKGHCLRLMVAAAKYNEKTKQAAISRAKALISSAFMTDRTRGVMYYLQLAEAQERDSTMEELKKSWGSNMDATEELIGVISSLDSDDAPKIIAALIKDPIFNINLAGHARRVVRIWAANRKRSVLSDEGLKLTELLLVTVGKKHFDNINISMGTCDEIGYSSSKVNQMSAYALLDAFGDIKKFSDEQKAKALKCLEGARGKLDPKAETSLYNQIGRLLASCKQFNTSG
eukprot:jgi/Bigna1/81557/fgenesh1_pg.81_\